LWFYKTYSISMDSSELRRRREKLISRYDILNFRMGHSNAATGRELKDCMLSFFRSLPPSFMEGPSIEDEKRFSIEDVRVREPFDALSEAIRQNLKKFGREWSYKLGR